MSLLRRIAVAARRAVLVAPALALAACGGNEFVFAPDASTDSESGDGAAGGPESAPETGTAADFCVALRAYYDRCQFVAKCDQQNLDNCSADAFDLSEAARAAFIACQAAIACNRGGTAWVHENCVSAKLAAAVPTPEQTKLAQDYCTTCMPGTTTCSPASFYREGAFQAADGPGFDALLYNDTIVRMIDQSCVTGLMCIAFRNICEDGIIAQQIPPDACKD